MAANSDEQGKGYDETRSAEENLARAVFELARAIDEFHWEVKRQIHDLAAVEEQNAEWISEALHRVANWL